MALQPSDKAILKAAIWQTDLAPLSLDTIDELLEWLMAPDEERQARLMARLAEAKALYLDRVTQLPEQQAAIATTFAAEQTTLQDVMEQIDVIVTMLPQVINVPDIATGFGISTDAPVLK